MLRPVKYRIRKNRKEGTWYIERLEFNLKTRRYRGNRFYIDRTAQDCWDFVKSRDPLNK